MDDFYGRWLAPEGPYPSEPQATCHECAMVRQPEASAYRESLKCCTYFPFIPNFSIGAQLSASTAQTQILEQAFAQGVITPLGLFPSQEYLHLKEELGPKAFGRNADLLCPFFNGQCAIWEYRPGVCRSFYCLSRNGEYWKQTEARLNLFEWTMAHEVLWKMGFTADETRQMSDGRYSSPASTWFEYKNRVFELFERCFVIAQTIKKEEILHLMGSNSGAEG
jgi:Fe-S-cluster containining protein